MQVFAEVDEAGRITLPPVMAEALRLLPGTHIRVEQVGNSVTLLGPADPAAALDDEELEPELRWENGWPVFHLKSQAPVDVVEWIREDRDERDRHISAGFMDDGPKDQ